MARPTYEPRAETPVSPLLPAFPLPKSANAQLRQAARTTNDAFDMSPHFYGGSPTMARSPSISSASTSQWTSGLPATPSNIHPPPAYVAAFGASQVVSERKRRFSDDEDGGGASTAMSIRDDMQFSQNALALVNAFLDQLLYSFLGNAMSTSLTALRPAVRDVLRSRLATEAIASAEEELQELLAGGDEEEEEMNQRQTVAERSRKWDTELVWKRTRLRVMVYIRLGEMEDDDEERYVREDDLFHGSDRRFSHSSGLVSWAAAIFLTSVLEYVAEQVLQVAGQAADSRARRQSKNPRVSMSVTGMVTPVPDGVTVEDYDMEKVALNSTLGRLWRTWRKSLRSNNQQHAPPTPTTATSNNFSRRFSRDPFAAAMSPRRSSFGTAGPESVVSALDEASRRPSTSTNNDRGSPNAGDEELPEVNYPEHVLAANIPLPIGDAKRDVDEIEVPGLARDPDDPETNGELTPMDSEPKRRNSHAGSTPYSLIGSLIGGAMQVAGRTRRESSETMIQEKPILTRQRSASVPTPARRTVREKKDEEAVQDPEAADVPGDTETDEKPEQKANAAEMAAHKRDVSPDVKPVLDKLAENDPPEEDADKKESKGLLGGAAAGSAAAAAAALSIVYGSKFDKKEARKSSPAKDTDIEERDKQKHLIDMKRFSVPSMGQRNEAQGEKEAEKPEQESNKQPEVPQTVLRPATADSNESFSLNDKNGEAMVQHPKAKPRHLSGEFDQEQGREEQEPAVDIGVARTSDTAVSTPRTEEPPVEYHQARDSFTNPAPRRPSRLILGANEPDVPSPLRKESPNPQQEEDTGVPEVTPESFLSKRSLSLTASSKQPLDKSKSQSQPPPPQPRHLRDSPKRASVPSALVLTPGNGSHGQVSPAFEKTPSPWRQSFAAGDKNSQWAYSPKKSISVSEPSPTIQEHPVIQKIMKRQENKVKEEESSKALTSASIKGPEDFEMFVQGGDTVKYTLTPENVRDDPSPTEAVPYPKQTRTVERERAPPTPPPKQSPPLDSRMGRSQTAKQATSAVPIPPEPADDETSRERESKREKRRSISRPPVRNTSVHRKSGLMAREPQVMTESTRDFADFIRSTGPSKEQEILPIHSNRSTTSLNSLRQAHINGSRSSSPGAASARSLNRNALQSENVPPVPPMPNKGKNNMQPRGPTSTTDGSSSELIDFIRTGPNGSSQSGQPRQHRISRSVAPFRTTMDSDQLNEWGERLAAQPDLKLNTNVPSAPSVKSASSMKSSVRTSANSRAPLLNNSNAGETVHPAHSGVPQRLSSLGASASSPKTLQTTTSEPAVKRYRNKDPYAIDLDDEDDDLLTALPRNRREEESLIDFLRSSEPPENNYPRGMTNGSNSPQTANKGAPRRGSTPTLKTHGADAVSMGRRGSMPNRDGPQPKTANSSAPRQPSGTTAIAVGPITKPRPKMEARVNNPRTGDATTTDLADFLRSSAPPQSNNASPSPGPGMRGHSSKGSVASDKASKKSSGRRSLLGSLFSRSSAPKQKGYLDM